MHWTKVFLPAIAACIHLVSTAPTKSDFAVRTSDLLPYPPSSSLALGRADEVYHLERRIFGKGKGKGKEPPEDEGPKIEIEMFDMAFIQPTGEDSILYKQAKNGKSYEEIKYKKGKFLIDTKHLSVCHALVITASKGAFMSHFPPQVCEYLDDKDRHGKAKKPNTMPEGHDALRTAQTTTAVKKAVQILKSKKSFLLTGEDEHIYLVHGPAHKISGTLPNVSKLLTKAGYPTDRIQEEECEYKDLTSDKVKGMTKEEYEEYAELGGQASVAYVENEWKLEVSGEIKN